MDIFATLIYIPLYNLIIAIYHLLGDNLGLSIIAVALIFRIITIPLTIRQIKFAENNRELQEKMKGLKEKHKNNDKKLQEEQLKLQQEYLPSIVSGCLPMILQLVVLSQMFIILGNIFKDGTEGFNRIAYPFIQHFAAGATFNTTFLGIDLAKHASDVLNSGIGAALPYLVLVILVGLTQYLSTKILNGRQPKPAPAKEKSASEPEDFGEIFQRTTQQTMLIFPILTTFFALNFPAGLALYWTTQNGFVILQQLITDRIWRKQQEVAKSES